MVKEQDYPLWAIERLNAANPHRIWCSDGHEVMNYPHGGDGVSVRLIVGKLGFLDVTTAVNCSRIILDFNSARQVISEESVSGVLQVELTLSEDGSFKVCICNISTPVDISGNLKALPHISDQDVRYFDSMIARNYVPYPHSPDTPGKSDQEIRSLGKRYFPWTPHGYQLAMALHDWTTASFTRMVFMKVFQYTSVQFAGTPHPLDLTSIAEMISASEWGTFKPSDPDFMNSFMMLPTSSRDEIAAQLQNVHTELQRFSDVENRLLSIAIQSLPRTSTFTRRYLYSGQVDIKQMGIDRFGIEMFEFPGNAGPVGQPLQIPLDDALTSFLAPESTFTTKMAWSFTDSLEGALHYANGILLVLQCPLYHVTSVWETGAYVTPLSDDPDKNEYVFPAESKFRVKSIRERQDLRIIVLEPEAEGGLRPATNLDDVPAGDSTHLALPAFDFSFDMLPPGDELPELDHFKTGMTRGRWCRDIYGAIIPNVLQYNTGRLPVRTKREPDTNQAAE